jgi:hypothetical protein
LSAGLTEELNFLGLRFGALIGIEIFLDEILVDAYKVSS